MIGKNLKKFRVTHEMVMKHLGGLERKKIISKRSVRELLIYIVMQDVFANLF